LVSQSQRCNATYIERIKKWQMNIKFNIQSYNPYLKAKDSHFKFSYAFHSEKAYAKMMKALQWRFPSNYHIVYRDNAQYETYSPIDCR